MIRSTTTISASGGLIAKTHCQPKLSVNQPPSTGPPAVVSAEAAAQTPIARLRSSLGYVAPIKARLAGVTVAAEKPSRARQAINQSIVGAIAQAIDERPKPAQPTASTRPLP